MADKEKRLRKIFSRMMLKGQLKSVKTLEEAIIVIVEDPSSFNNNVFFHKRGYQMVLDRGNTFPEDLVHFTVPTNPRNIMKVTQGILFKTDGAMLRPL